MTQEERSEVIDIFISICEKFLNANKHFHLEPVLARHTIQAIKELEEENAELQERIREVENDSNNCEHWSYERIKELELQIEKMKNVGNCKKAMLCAEWNEKQTNLGCMKFCKDCKKWEMAE